MMIAKGRAHRTESAEDEETRKRRESGDRRERREVRRVSGRKEIIEDRVL